LGIMAEFPPEYFPRVAAVVEQLNTWFTWIDVVVVVGVILASTVGRRAERERA